MKEFCDLQDMEFRELLCNELSVFFPVSCWSAIFLMKKKLNNNDMLNFYFELNKCHSIYVEFIVNLAWFNYKMRKINDEQAAKFSAIVKEKTGFTHPNNKMTWEDLYKITFNLINKTHFCDELMNIFLEQI